MKKKRFFYGILGLLLAFGLTLCGCPNPADGTPKDQEQPEAPEQPGTPEVPAPVDPAFWFGEIHAALISRIGTVTSEEYTGDMGQIANVQYVCDAINTKWGAGTVTLVDGTASQAANCEYLLKMIDKANRNTTTYGTSAYATLQVIDTIAVDTAVQTLWKPAGKFVAVSGGSDNAAYSTDGETWTATTMPHSDNWQSVTYGNGTFVALAYSSDKAAYSTDGITWTATTMPSTDNWRAITYGGE
jgi:hypothetical protein